MIDMLLPSRMAENQTDGTICFENGGARRHESLAALCADKPCDAFAEPDGLQYGRMAEDAQIQAFLHHNRRSRFNRTPNGPLPQGSSAVFCPDHQSGMFFITVKEDSSQIGVINKSFVRVDGIRHVAFNVINNKVVFIDNRISPVIHGSTQNELYGIFLNPKLQSHS